MPTRLFRMPLDLRGAGGQARQDIPLGQCGRAEGLESLSIGEMAFEIEVIMDVGVDAGENL